MYNRKNKKEKNKPKKTNPKRGNNHSKPRRASSIFAIFWESNSNKNFIRNKDNRNKTSNNYYNVWVYVSLLLSNKTSNNRKSSKDTDKKEKKTKRRNNTINHRLGDKIFYSLNVRFNQ